MRKSTSRQLNNPSVRLWVVFSGFLILAVLIIFRLFRIQVLQHKEYRKMAEDQYWNLQEISPLRGTIYTSDGYVLAGAEYSYILYGEPNKVENVGVLVEILAQTVSESRKSEDKDEDELFNYYLERFDDLLNRDLYWVGLLRNITPIEKEKIEKLSLDGIGFEEEFARYYPENTMAAHVLGFVASDEYGQKKGYYGIEGELNEDLKGRPGRIVQELDATGAPILAGGYTKIAPTQGRNVVLTINRAVQYIIEKKIKKGVEEYNAVSGSIIVMDPKTGDIYAMANYPTYFPGNFSLEDEFVEESPHRKQYERKNIALSNTYEPGSVMKPLTISSAIDLKLINPETTFEDNGPVWYSGYKIDNWDGKHYGTQNIIQLLQKSNNIGAAWVGHRIGSKRLHSYLDNFGMGEKTGIELEGEDTGILRDHKTWSDVALANISFGQGISATPLQVLNAFNAIANGGYLLEPKIISKLVDEDRETVLSSKLVRRVISKSTSDTLVDLLEKAAFGGEAKFFVLKNYRISGKTGTAQIPVGGKYDPKRTNATFVGFMTKSKKFSMIVKLEEPQTSSYAAETSAPLWMETATELVKYFGLPPDKID